jgi:hypothetical protein
MGQRWPIFQLQRILRRISTPLSTEQQRTLSALTTTYRRYFSGYLADIHFLDGQALDPTSFGEFDTNGVWQPIAYASGLTYGTNGFHLPFSDNSTAAALGTDTSGNGHTWTVNNLAVTGLATSTTGNISLGSTARNFYFKGLVRPSNWLLIRQPCLGFQRWGKLDIPRIRQYPSNAHLDVFAA